MLRSKRLVVTKAPEANSTLSGPIQQRGVSKGLSSGLREEVKSPLMSDKQGNRNNS